MNTLKLSKFLAFVLRHKPQSIGLSLDKEGWAEITSLIACAEKNKYSFSKEEIQEVVRTCEKKRYSISEDGLRIRAVQGHSTDEVDLSHVEKIPPNFLFHGTSSENVEFIFADGINSGKRHHVHLSESLETSYEVGRRYGDPIVLTIETADMVKDGFKFYQAENGVWLVSHVPSQYIL